MKKVLIAVVAIAVLGGAVYWYGLRAGWFLPPLPHSPPTKDELRRMDEVDRTSNTQAPNAVPGIGVRPVGSLPRPEPILNASGTQSVTTDTATSTENGTSTPPSEL